MTLPNPRPSPVASLDQTRFDKLMGARIEAEAKLEAAGERLGDFCRLYSRAHGFRVNLTPEQVARDLAHKGEEAA